MWPVADHRQVINGIIHRLGTGVQWRELPERFGPWKTVHKRHLRGRPMAPGNDCFTTSKPSPMR
jgi:transposase